MNENELVESVNHLINASLDAVSSVVAFEFEGKQFKSEKSIIELLSSSLLDVEQEISIAKIITESTITLINNHENENTRGYIFNVFKEDFLDAIEKKETAQNVFMRYMTSLFKYSQANNIPQEKGIENYLSIIFSPSLAYLKSVAAKQGIFLPELLNNEIRNGVTFDLFNASQWEKYLYKDNAAGVLYAVYDESLANEAINAISTSFLPEQINYLYYYLAYTAYQIAFGSFIAMELVENLTGLNFGFEQNNRLVKNITAKSQKQIESITKEKEATEFNRQLEEQESLTNEKFNAQAHKDNKSFDNWEDSDD